MAKTFRTKVSAEGPGGAWWRVAIPFDVEKAFGAKGRVSVKATVGGEAFHTSIFPNGDGTHHMMFNKGMQKVSGVTPGETLSITLDRDAGEEAEVSGPLAVMLKRNRKAATMFKALTPAGRREFIQWITSAKQDATREVRAAKTIEMVLAGKKRYSS